MMTRAPAVYMPLLVSLLVLTGPLVLAQSAAQRANALAHELMSPYCPGFLLANCQSERARVLRAEILSRLKEGESAETIEADLIARFGESIRTVPEFRGAGIVVWTGPVVLGLAAFSMLVVLLRRATRRRGQGREPDDAGDLNGGSPLQLRLQDELDALD